MKNIYCSIFFFFLFLFSVNCIKATGLQTEITKDSVLRIMNRVADWQIEHFPIVKPGENGYATGKGIDDWTTGTLYIGMLSWAEISPKPHYYHKWLYNIGDSCNWTLRANLKKYPQYQLYHADELCVGQLFLSLHDIYHEPRMISSVLERVNWIYNNPPDTTFIIKNKQSWTWIDAIFMAAPVFSKLSEDFNDPKYIDFMNYQFQNAYKHLYHKEHKLFYRDSSYVGKKENGKEVFWGRGNGWIAAGIVNILKTLPKESRYRESYQNILKELMPSLMQHKENDYWHTSILDAENYPNPETSGTTLIVYAMAYCLNEGLLPKDKYKNELLKVWQKLCTFVDSDGKLGWVQPIGESPKNVTKDMTEVYGVGGFLLAGSQIYRLVSE